MDGGQKKCSFKQHSWLPFRAKCPHAPPESSVGTRPSPARAQMLSEIQEGCGDFPLTKWRTQKRHPATSGFCVLTIATAPGLGCAEKRENAFCAPQLISRSSKMLPRPMAGQLCAIFAHLYCPSSISDVLQEAIFFDREAKKIAKIGNNREADSFFFFFIEKERRRSAIGKKMATKMLHIGRVRRLGGFSL